MQTRNEILAELGIRFALAAVFALVVWAVDEPLLGINLAWWVCATIGVALVFFGSVFVIVVTDDLRHRSTSCNLTTGPPARCW
jgi:low affinity Fe/Cu permease